MPWPLSQDYNEAIQNPAQCFADPELRQGEAETNTLGLPAPRSGNFADVYAVVTGSRKWAVKCFTRQIPGLQERYQQISLHLAENKPSFMVDFVFQEQGIRVHGNWYPILKMQWVEGFLLNQFVRENLDKPQVLDTLSQLWVKLSVRLREAQIAHCDLQHGNVLLVPGKNGGSLHVRLVDYDGMCVPSLTMLKSIELGHPSYQHPQRQRDGIYSMEVDRFSHLVIYTALRALVAGGKALWEKYDDGDNLLFKPTDYQAPTKSPLCYELLKSSTEEGRKLVQVLMQALAGPLDQVPLLESVASDLPISALQTKRLKADARGTQIGAPAYVFGGAIRQDVAFSGSISRSKRKRTSAFVPALLTFVFLGLAAGALLFVLLRRQDKDATPVAANKTSVPTTASGEAPARKTLVAQLVAEAKTGPGSFSVAEDKAKSEPVADSKSQPDSAPKQQAETKTPLLPPSPGGSPDLAKTSNKENTQTKARPKEFRNVLGIEFVLVPKGKSWLGGGGGKDGTEEVDIEHDFYLGKYEVTQQEWQNVMGTNPAYFSRTGPGRGAVEGVSDDDLKRFPVENITWDDAMLFVAEVNKRIKETGWMYRLPTEVEWEYACRGGPLAEKRDSAFYWYFDKPTNQLLPEQANFNLKRTCKVGSYLPNRLGLYDMHGNIWEWCNDTHVDIQNLLHLEKGTSQRVERGGCWHDDLSPFQRTAARISFPPSHRVNDHGLRLARVPSTIPAWVSLQSVAHPRLFISHADYLGVLRQRTSEGIGNEIFEIVPGLTNSGFVSFRSARMPDHYLAHGDFRIRLQKREESEGFRQNATFRQLAGLAGARGKSFAAVNYPDHVIHARSNDLYIDRIVNSGQFSAESTFVVVDRSRSSANASPTIQPMCAIRTFSGHVTNAKGELDLVDVAFAPDGRTAISAGQDMIVRMWEIETGKEIRRFEGHTGRVTSLCFCPDGLQFVSGSDDRTLRLWDVANGKELNRFEGHLHSIGYVMVVTPDGSRIVSYSADIDKTIRIWDLKRAKEIRHVAYVGDIHAFTTDGRRVLVSGEDHILRIWDLDKGKVRPLFGPSRGGAFSADGRFAVAIGDDKRLWLYESGSGKLVRRFQLGPDVGQQATFSPDGQRVLISYDHQDYATLWDVQNGREIYRIPGNPKGFGRIRFSPDGTRALSAGRDGSVRLWALP